MRLLGLGVLVQLVANTLVGLRLLLLARRTRRLPELCLGLCCLLMGGVGLPLSLLVRAGHLGSEEMRHVWLAGCFAAQNLACLALYVATWRVFRPESAGARVAVAAVGVLFALSTPGSGADAGLAYWVGWIGRGGAFVWSAAESLRYAAMQRRRLALGLADPVVADRFRLWAVCCCAVVFGFAVFLGARLQGTNPAESPATLFTTSVVGLVAGVSLWLAFAPPRFYLARIADAHDLAAPVSPSGD